MEQARSLRGALVALEEWRFQNFQQPVGIGVLPDSTYAQQTRRLL